MANGAERACDAPVIRVDALDAWQPLTGRSADRGFSAGSSERSADSAATPHAARQAALAAEIAALQPRRPPGAPQARARVHLRLPLRTLPLPRHAACWAALWRTQRSPLQHGGKCCAARRAGMVDPNSRHKLAWDWLVSELVVLSTLSTPLDLAFFDASCRTLDPQARPRVRRVPVLHGVLPAVRGLTRSGLVARRRCRTRRSSPRSRVPAAASRRATRQRRRTRRTASRCAPRASPLKWRRWTGWCEAQLLPCSGPQCADARTPPDARRSMPCSGSTSCSHSAPA
jgi:hypothetical protein